MAFAIYLKHCILGSKYVRSIVNSFLTHQSAHIFILHPHSHELQYPISKLLCLSIVVDCRVDIESSLSPLAYHCHPSTCISSTQHSNISVWIANCNIQQYIYCVTPSVDCCVSSLSNYSVHCVYPPVDTPTDVSNWYDRSHRHRLYQINPLEKNAATSPKTSCHQTSATYGFILLYFVGLQHWT